MHLRRPTLTNILYVSDRQNYCSAGNRMTILTVESSGKKFTIDSSLNLAESESH